MNQEFSKEFGRTKPALPLKETGNIVHGNATRLDWEIVCPKKEGDEIFLLGNPPYLGAKMQSSSQKEDMAIVFKGFENYKKLDYIGCWFIKGANYIQKSNSRFSFVTTSSICQGEMVELLWPDIFKRNLEIYFAHQPFKWTNNAKSKAGVTVVIIGIQNKSNRLKHIYLNNLSKVVSAINPYLTDGSDTIVSKRSIPISRLSPMLKGSIAYDDGNLLLSEEERNNLIEKNPECKLLIKRIVGSDEFINGVVKYCLWVKDNDIKLANSINFVKDRLEKVVKSRSLSPNKGISDFSDRPHKFVYITYKETPSLIVPSVSSERRTYIPIGFLDSSFIVTNAAYVVYDADSLTFALISSRMHMSWVKAVAGRLDSRIRYSSNLCYNTFPIPNISENQKTELEQITYSISLLSD